MILYSGTLSNGAPGEIQESNLNLPSVELDKAIRSGDEFVLVSRSCVFDLSQNRSYDEGSRRNSRNESGKVLAIMEDKVLSYEKGFVIRVRHLLSEIFPAIKGLASMTPPLSPMNIYPTSDEICDYIAGLIIKSEWGDTKKVIHAPSIAHPLAAVIMRIVKDDERINIVDDGEGVCESGPALLSSSVFIPLLGAVSMVECINYNEYYVNLKLYGGEND
jgi:hypothetical protein